MARIVLACWGSYGDLFPSLGLAVRLKALGHTPVIASCPYFAELVRQEGFEFRPLRPDVTPGDKTLIERVMDPKGGSEVVIRELMVPAVRDAYADLTAAAHGADLIVSHPVTFAAPMVAEKLGLPWVSTVLSPISFFSPYDFPMLPPMTWAVHLRRLGPWTGRVLMRIARRITGPWMAPVHTFRAELGLPRIGDPLYEGQFSPFGTLALFSPVFGPPQRDWPPHTSATGFVFYNQAIPMPPELSAFLDAGDPPIVFTLGTSAVGAAGTFYEESVKAVATLGRRAVLLVGKNPENLPRDPLPASVIAVESAPHDGLFPRAAAIVHQGGIGTTGQALRSGRPALIVPHAHDQPDNAFRASNLGVARVIYPDRYTARRVVGHLRALLDDRRYTDRAGEIAGMIQLEDGAAVACDALIAVLTDPRCGAGVPCL
jgi:UDP:flavonoid glycosyltransferase YjiC (YdhE family)